MSRRVTAPLSHSTPLTRLARAASPGLARRSWPHDDINARSCCTCTSSTPLRTIGPERIISAAPPGTRRSSGRRRWRAASRRRSAGRAAPRRRAAITSPVWAPPRRMRRARRGAHLAAQAVELLGAQLAGRAARIQPRAPQDLVGQQVADARHHRLVHEPRLQRRGPAAHARAEVVAGDLGGVGPDGGEVGLQARAAQAALVAQGQRAAVLEVHDEAVPCRGAPAPRRARCARPSRGAARAPGPSSEVSTHIALPRRCAAVSSRPTSASAISPGACGRQT